MRYADNVSREQWQAIASQQQTALQVWTKLLILDRGCSLLGGAPRDWILGREASDLDFFITVSPRVDLRRFLFEALDIDSFRAPGEERREEYIEPLLTSVLEFQYQGITVQVMTTEEETFRLPARFPCNASKVKAHLQYSTHSYTRPAEASEVTLCEISAALGESREASRFFDDKQLIFDHDTQIKYIDKMLTKFPEEDGYTWIVKDNPSEQVQDDREELTVRPSRTTRTLFGNWAWYPGGRPAEDHGTSPDPERAMAETGESVSTLPTDDDF